MNTLIPVFPKLDEPLRKRIADAFAEQIARCVLESMRQEQDVSGACAALLPEEAAGAARRDPHPSPNTEHKYCFTN